MYDTVPPLPHHERPTLVQMAVGVVMVIWNSLGLALAMMSQAGALDLSAARAAYFENQPLWLGELADIGPLAGVAGALAVLLQHRSAVPLLLAQLVIVSLASMFDLAMGTSLLQSGEASLGPVIFAFALMLGQYAYARLLHRRHLIY